MISDLKRRKDAWLIDRFSELDAKTSLMQSLIDEKYSKMNEIKKEMHEIEYEMKIRKATAQKQQRAQQAKMMEQIKAQQEAKRIAHAEAVVKGADENANVQNKSKGSQAVNQASSK